MNVFAKFKASITHRISAVTRSQEQRLFKHYGHDQALYFRAKTYVQILTAAAIVLSLFIGVLLSIDFTMGAGQHSAFFVPFVTFMIIAAIASGMWALNGGFSKSRIIFFLITFVAAFTSVVMTGGFVESASIPILVVPVIISYCIFSSRMALGVALLTPIIYGICAYMGQILAVDYPNFAYQNLPFDRRLVPAVLTYTLIVLLLRNFDSANQKHLASAQALITENQTLASIDFLTGLPNRRQHIKRAKEVLHHSRLEGRYDSYVFSAAIDIDNFKHVNDSFGHLSGDDVLKAVAQGLKRLQSDTITAARVGGDEFVLFGIFSKPESIPLFVEEVVSALPTSAKTVDTKIDFACSIGIYCCKVSEFDVQDAIMCSDYALYQAKSREGVCAHIFSPEDRLEVNKSKQNLAIMKQRFEDGEMENHYQLMMPSGQKPAIVEALLQVCDDKGQRLNPAICLEAIDWLGLTLPFTQRQLKSAILDVMAVSDTLRLAYNLSPAQLHSTQLLSIVECVLEETQFDPERLILEISELTAYSDGIINTLHDLKKLGVKLAIDDFGVDQTCFQIFNKIDIDIIKTDRCLLSSAPENSLNRFILQQVGQYCQQFDVESVCEGVETDVMIEEMMGFGFNYLQGYAISRPGNLVEQLKVLKQGYQPEPKQKLYKFAL